MTRLDTTVMSAINPCLQVREDKVDHRQGFFRLLWVTPKRERIMPIAHSAKVVIPLPSVSADNGTCRYVVLDECCERFSVAARKRNISLFNARYNAKPKTPGISEFLGRNSAVVAIFPFRTTILGILAGPNFNSADYRSLMMNSSPFASRASTNATFVYFDGMRRSDGIAIRPHHTGTKLVKHRECRLISRDVKLTRKLEGGLAGRLCSHEVSAPKPSRERHMARLHNRPGSERCILFAGSATQHNRRSGCEAVRLADVPTHRAREAVWPAHRLQISCASAVIREDALEFRKACGKGCIHV